MVVGNIVFVFVGQYYLINIFSDLVCIVGVDNCVQLEEFDGVKLVF